MTNRLNQVIRAACRQMRDNISPTYQRSVSKRICSRIRTLKQYRYAKHIALYQAIGGEIDLSTLWKSAPLQGKYCYFPALNSDKTLSFIPATPATPFRKNRFGIAEPDVDRQLALPPEQLDIIFMPLVAFDENCSRIGMGAGYYDRTLEQSKNALLIGVAYEFQRQTYISPQPWDIPMDAVVTESAIYWRN